ncbi:MAG: hypothetical protein IPL19_07725 [Sandaracinaceae bacterium]|nr:hypothetical protein [Sandaracinaceae bacterium]
MSAPRPERRGVVTTLHCTLASALALSVFGCGSDAPSIPEGCNVYAWEPGVGDMSSFPTTDFLVEDASQPTGYQMTFPEGTDLTPYGPLGPLFQEHIVDLDGVGVQGEMWLGFSGTFDPALLPVADGEAHATDGIGIVVLPADGPPVLVPSQTRTSTNFLYVRPLTPLPEATRVAYFATRGLSAAAGGCLEPATGMRRLLRNPDDDRQAAIDGLEELGVVTSWRDLVALHVVTTQSITRESVAIAAHVDTLSPALTDTSCTDEGTHRRCSAMLLVEDYRAENGAVDIDVNAVAPQQTWEVPVSIWLPPASVAGPYPTVVFGHGLTDTRNSAGLFAGGFAEQGWATVAIDALVHGDHPSTGGEMLAGIQGTFRFFALTLSNPPVLDARRLRDHWRQSSYDKLQLTRMLTSDGDLDGDGTNDVDATQLVYFRDLPGRHHVHRAGRHERRLLGGGQHGGRRHPLAHRLRRGLVVLAAGHLRAATPNGRLHRAGLRGAADGAGSRGRLGLRAARPVGSPAAGVGGAGLPVRRHPGRQHGHQRLQLLAGSRARHTARGRAGAAGGGPAVLERDAAPDGQLGGRGDCRPPSVRRHPGGRGGGHRHPHEHAHQ